MTGPRTHGTEQLTRVVPAATQRTPTTEHARFLKNTARCWHPKNASQPQNPCRRSGVLKMGGMRQQVTASPNRAAPQPAGYGRLPQPVPAKTLREPICLLPPRTGTTDCLDGTCAPSMRSSPTLSPSSAPRPVSGAFAPEKAAQKPRCAPAMPGNTFHRFIPAGVGYNTDEAKEAPML